MLRSIPVLLAALLLIAAGRAPAVTIDFEGFAHGDIVAAPIASHAGYTLVAENFVKSFDAAVAFDTSVTGSLEPDLQFDPATGFATGNISDQDLGNILILQANSNCNSTRCFAPEDEGRRPAGKFTFLLDEVARTFSFDVIDVDDATREAGRITFFLLEEGSVSTTVASFSFADFTALGQGVVYGNNSANHVELGEIGPYNAFEILMGGSGGVDNIFANGTPVPEPASAALIGLGLSALAAAGRRRRR
jgi:hypothetical protein